ncbi:MAG: electron transporter RnfC [Candidatus [Bacteroides] periocalifornicus]|uniref:Ion-translocating oxidoreductase complex subunit C n=1 Tax=Candidatus [Bacteroides] periocalifornicus TaxID=1702214 RepID=A0A0Q4B774_9BACT|nr:MAG: electron transporter RnfC [Candidatus [Bacteroides] periocalifornicus]
MKLKTFRMGGVHPLEGKLTAGKAIEQMPVPSEVVMLVSQHLGAPAECVVQKGDQVKVGQLLAKATGFVCANMHSSVSGSVTKVDKILDASGYPKPAIFISVEGDEWVDEIDRTPTVVRECNLEPKEIIDRIAAAGVVGMGGATFPTHVKLSVPPGRKAEFLIINGVECEPYLTSDHRLMLEHGEELLVGIAILRKALGNPPAIIGIERNKPDAIAHLTELAKGFEGISVQPLKVKYPQGGEKQLIEAITRREVPAGKLPIDVGAVVQNVGTAFAVYEAVQKNKPLIERVVTVTGPSLTNPVNVLARVGTPITRLLEFAGGMPEDTGKVISGGPMMGKALKNIAAPVTKGTSGVLVMPEPLALRSKEQQCIRCSKCTFGCPMGLEPYLLYKQAQHALLEDMERDYVMSCIECGSCSFTCPAALPLLDFIRLGKAQTGAMIRARSAKK